MASAEELSRTALKIYVHLLESGDPRGVRDIARALNMPVSTVHYHVKRLEEMGIVKVEENGYVVAKPIKIEGYILLGKKLVPRFLVYSLFFLGIIMGQVYTVASSDAITSDKIVSLLVSAVSFAIFLFEGLNMRSRLKACESPR